MDPARQLLHRYLDEIASPADLVELARLLPQRPDLADELTWAAHSEALMESHLSERRALNAVAAVLAQSGPPLRGGFSTQQSRHGVAGHFKWCAAAVLLVTAGVMFGFWMGRTRSDPGAVVSGRVRIDGVEVIDVPDDSWIEVVGEDAAVIRLSDGSRAELSPASAAVLRPRTRGARKVVELDRGRAAFHVQKGRNRFRVDTPLGSVSTQDAKFCVELQTEEEEGEDPLNKHGTLVLVVAALVGQVEVDSGGKRYVLAAGEQKSFADKSASAKQKPAFSGTIVEASAGSLTVESPASKKGGEAVRKQYKLTPKTEFVYFGVGKEGEKPTVGYLASVWLAEGSDDTLARVQLGMKQVIFDGKIAAVAADAKSFTLERPSKGGPISTEIKIAEGAKLVYKDADKGDKPTVGYFARVWMKPGTQDAASGVVFSSKSIADAFGKKKTGPNTVKKPFLSGTVKALAADGKSFTLAFPKSKKGDEPAPVDIRIGENTKVLSGKEEGKLAVGQPVSVLLQEGAAKTAETVLIGKPSGTSGKKPGSKGEQSITLDGTVAAVAADAKSFTLERPSKGGPIQTEIKIVEGVKVVYKDVDKGDKPTVGYFARVVLAGKTQDAPTKIVFSSKKLTDAPTEKKSKTGKKAGLAGTVKALAADGKSFTLLPPKSRKGGEPTPINIQIGENTKITTGKEAAKLAVGQTVTVWLQVGSTNSAATVQVGPAAQPEKPKPVKGKKPSPEETEKKPDEPKKPRAPAKPPRDPAPTAAVIDAEIGRRLAADKIPASPQAGDAEFLRRVTLDLTGRIPTYRETVAFLDGKDLQKRRKLVDELLDSPAYGEHFSTIWRNVLAPRNAANNKGTRDTLSPWLAEQFNGNRGWNAIVADLLNAEGAINTNPASAFVMANAENNQPQPSKIAGAAARLFWGVNLRCAECHNHPFANWKQDDFWGTAAFFGKLQFTGYKGGPASLTEAIPEAATVKGKKFSRPTSMRGSAIRVPDGAGKAAGRLVKARFLDGGEPALDEKEPFRPRFAAWATAADNPYFARAAVNRMWAHFFGRGFVHPLDGFNESNPPSHPELLDRLASEFASSGFDLKHIARCITTSKAYQRTSRPQPGNEKDAAAFSHVNLKVLTPEVLYESLMVVMTPDKNARPIATGKKGKTVGKKLGVSREVFVASFRTGEESDPLEYTQGIPQHLRLMNASLLNHGAPVVDTLSQSPASQTEAIDVLYLTALSRRPTPEETRLMSGYLSRRKDAREGYSGVLWILLNSSEFALNR